MFIPDRITTSFKLSYTSISFEHRSILKFLSIRRLRSLYAQTSDLAKNNENTTDKIKLMYLSKKGPHIK